MALIMYLTRAPKYENVSMEDIKTMESYFAWQREKDIGGRYACNTFEEWCGKSESCLPNSDVINYYKDFYKKNEIYVEGIGKAEGYGLTEQVARFVKMNQVYQWFIDNVTNKNIDKEFYEVTEEQINNLLDSCKKIKDCIIVHNEEEYDIDENVAKANMPIMEQRGFFFGPKDYNNLYAYQIIQAYDEVKNIVNTTDFSKQTIYFNAI